MWALTNTYLVALRLGLQVTGFIGGSQRNGKATL
jgi:hypothetical protein